MREGLHNHIRREGAAQGSPMHHALLSLAAGSFLFACAAKGPMREPAQAGEGETAETNQSAPGRIGSHGMVLAGAPGAAFLSHIPMFGNPHDVQMIVSGTLESMAPVGAVAPIPTTFSDQGYTFVPDRMSLDELRLGTLKTLNGNIFVGNFEQGGRPIPGRIAFHVTRVIHQHILEPQAVQNNLTYFVFGSQRNTLVAHRIAGSPGFDEILRVSLTGANLPTDEALATGVEATASETGDAPAQRLGLDADGKTMKIGDVTVTVKSATLLSCLVGPDFAEPCAN